MNEQALVQKVLKEGEAIVKRQDRLVSAVDKVLKESGRTMTTLDKVKLATVIDNVSNLLMMNEAEGTQVTDIAKKAEFLNLVVTTWAKSTLPVSTMTFAMSQETSVVYYLSYQYDTTKGGITKGDNLNSYDQYWVDDTKVESASKYASSEIDVETVGSMVAAGTYQIEFTPVVAGSIRIEDTGNVTYVDKDGEIFKEEDGAITGGALGTIDYTTGVITSTTLALTEATMSYEYNNQISPVKVPQLKLKDTTFWQCKTSPNKLFCIYNNWGTYMKNFLILLTIILLTQPAIASCSIDSNEPCTASVLDEDTLQERYDPDNLDELKKTDAFQPRYTKPYYDELINTTPPQNTQDYNSNCQFGVCLPGENAMEGEILE